MSPVIRRANLGSSVLVPVPRTDTELEEAALEELAAHISDLRAELEAAHATELAAAVAAARQEGWEEGRVVGRAELDASAATFTTQISAAAATYRDAADRNRAELGEQLVGLALEIVAAILGHRVSDVTEGLVGRVRAALAEIEERPLRLSVHPDAVTLCEQLLADERERDEIVVSASADLAPGEVTLAGDWASAELTWPKLLQAAAEAQAIIAAASPDEAANAAGTGPVGDGPDPGGV